MSHYSNTHHINEELTILDEFSAITPKKGKLFSVLTMSSVFYIACALINFGVDLKKFSLKPFDWRLAIMFLALPFLGLIFHISGKKIGWIINCFYYSLITSMIFYVLFFLGKGISLKGSWLGFLMLGLTLTSTTVLFSKPIREYFRVSVLLCIVVVGFSVALGAFMVYATLSL